MSVHLGRPQMSDRGMLVGKNGRFKLLEASETSAFARKHVRNIRICPQVRPKHPHWPTNGFKVFELADAGDERILTMLDEYARIAAVQIYNLQCVLDVEAVAIGGGISAREDLIDRIRTQLQAIFDAEAAYQIPPTMPRVVACQFRSDANLIGAWHDNVSR